MAIERLIFGPNQESGLEELAGSSPVAVNVVIEPNGAVRRRPGIVESSIATDDVIDENGIEALHYTDGGKLYAVGGTASSGRKVYRVSTGNAMDLSPAGPQTLGGSRRPTLVETEMLLVLAAGDFPQKVQLSDDQCSLLGGDPPRCSHIIANGQRLLANDLSENRSSVRYSDLAEGLITYAGHETWSGVGTTAGSFAADARPDAVVAIAENRNETWVFGSRSLQIFGPDATFVFVPVIGVDSGCGAPYSIVKADGMMFWLDDKAQFVSSDGRGVQPISSPELSNTLRAIARAGQLADCYGYRVKTGTCDCIVWTFPTDGRSFALQLGGGWSQWQGWSGNNFQRLPILSHHLAPDGRNLVGTLDGRIGELSEAAFDDLGDTLMAYATTGYNDRGTDALKHCEAVRLTFRQAAGSSALVWLEYRDSPGEWDVQIPIELDGEHGESAPVEIRGLGTYRRRQWRLRFDSAAEIVLAQAEEQFRVVQ